MPQRGSWREVPNWLDHEELVSVREQLRAQGKTVVFTNGCFDILHRGHLTYLEQARELGDTLIVALNTDASIKRLKGEHRPIYPEAERAEVLAAMQPVDYVTLFEEDTPAKIIDALVPDVLVKGGDWPIDQIVGRETVQANRGRVLSIPLVDGWSTTTIIERVQTSNPERA